MALKPYLMGRDDDVDSAKYLIPNPLVTPVFNAVGAN